VAFVPLFADQVALELSAVAAEALGGALLISPAGDIAFVRGGVSPDGAHVARTHAPQGAAALDDLTAVLHCDDGSRVHLLAISDGWVLAVQTRVRSELSMGLVPLLRRARNNLSLWLAYTQLPQQEGRDPDRGAAPAEVFAERPRWWGS